METCRETEKIELTSYLTGLDKALHTLCYRCVNVYKFPVSKHKFRYFYDSCNKELTIEPFNNGIIKDLEIKTVKINGHTNYYVGIKQTKNILGCLVMSNLNIFLIDRIFYHENHLMLDEKVLSKLRLLEKLRK